MDFDVVIVGAGPAGCVLAARLSENPDTRVALIEAGGENDGLMNRVPVGAAWYVRNRNACNWAFETVPQPGLNGRCGYQPRGRGLGGSGAINAMCFVRGQPQDFDDWVTQGAAGWSWREVLPIFKRMEHNERGADAWRGVGGPLNVADLRSPNPFGRLFIEAAQQAGIALNPDFNGATQEGVGPYQVTQKNGERFSAARAYLAPARARPNLTVLTDTTALRVRFENKRALGVECFYDGQRQLVRAQREVILACGALQSPQLLMLSGVGPGAHLQARGIEVVADVPGVGQNLQDHLDIVVNRRVHNTDLLGFSMTGAYKFARALWRWQHERRGLLTSNFAEAGAFVRTLPQLTRPDVQLHFVIGMVDNHARTLHWGHGMSLHACDLRPYSRGEVTLASADPFTAPRIDPRFLSDERDLDTLVRAFRLIRKIFAQPAFAPFAGADPARELYFAHVRTDDEIRAALRQHADTIYHPSGTCRMGDVAHDALAVLDPQMRVRDVTGLRVVDASAMPTLVSGNTQAAVIMMAERVAQFIQQPSSTPS